MKRFFLFLVAVMLYVAGVAFGKCELVSLHFYQADIKKMIETAENRWVLYHNTLLRIPLADHSEVRHVQYTSQNSGIIAGHIDRVLIDDEDRLIAISAEGGVSIFDRKEWIQTRRLYKPHSREQRVLGVLDAKIVNGVLLFVSVHGVHSVDLQRYEVQRLVEFKEVCSQVQITEDGRVYFLGRTLHGTYDNRTGRREIHEDSSQAHAASCPVHSEYRQLPLQYPDGETVVKSAHDSIYRSLQPEQLRGHHRNENWIVRYAVNDMCIDRNGTVYLATSTGVHVYVSPQVTFDVAPTSHAQITVYPNPATEQATVELQHEPDTDDRLSIVDLVGSVVHVTPLPQRTMSIDVSGLKGAYRVVVEGRRYRTSVPLMVVR